MSRVPGIETNTKLANQRDVCCQWRRGREKRAEGVIPAPTKFYFVGKLFDGIFSLKNGDESQFSGNSKAK